MSRSIDLVWIGEGPPPDWPLGEATAVRPTPGAVAVATRERLAETRAEAWLFWSSRLEPPDPARVSAALERPGDVWHAGLRLGMAGLPRAIDYVAPTWMLNRDPDPSIEATSWRLSLEACLVREEVLRTLGGVRAEFETLTGAGLELGHRWISQGAMMRHRPALLEGAGSAPAPGLSLADEMRFVFYRFGPAWLRWSLFRAVLTRRAGLVEARQLICDIAEQGAPEAPRPLRAPRNVNGRPATAIDAKVSILVPTVDRYPYLEVLLDQLRRQTVPPHEIVVVDQTAAGHRQDDLEVRFPDLPLRVLVRDRPGQCSSRNAGLEACSGDYVLFLDDDDEVPPDVIERHLMSLLDFRSDASCGVAEEDGAGELPDAFRLIRTSDVFPTNNSMIRKHALAGSGLFDLAYDRGARADGDLGTRLYLSGALMVLNPEISVLHHHAPSGGLRVHKARVQTYAKSRRSLTSRHLPAITEIYLARRYFTPAQVREMLWLYVAGTLSVRGSRGRRAAKAAVSLVLLPHTLWQIRSRNRAAAAMFTRFPQIPAFSQSAEASSEAAR